MTARQKTLATLVLAAVAGVLVWQIFRPRIPDPIYDGERLSYWLAQCPSDPTGEDHFRTQWEKAEAAVLHSGTNAIPLLLRLMQAHDSSLKRKSISFSKKIPFIKSAFVPDEDKRYQALRGFLALGPDGRSAVPELVRIYDLNPSEDTRAYVVMILGSLGPGASQSIPLLVRAATNANFVVRINAIKALGQMRVQGEVIVPVLLMSLKDSATVGEAVESLGNFGPQAMAAIPRLLELRKTLKVDAPLPEGPPLTRWSIDDALEKIELPAAAANATAQMTNSSPSQ